MVESMNNCSRSASALKTLAKTTIYYDSYEGNLVPVYNGSSDVLLTIGSNNASGTRR